MLCIFSSYNGRVEIAEVIVAGGGIIGLSSALELARHGFRLYPEYLSTVEAFSGRSVHVRTRAAISTDEEDGASVCHERTPGGGALAPDCFGPGGGKLDRASAGYQRRAAGDREVPVAG
jgi:hypothetical protein